MKFKITLLAAAASFTLFSNAAWAENIKIGFNVPLTGFAAADGESAKNGAELAIEQVNAAGGINGDKLELVVYDDQASPKEAVPVAQKLIDSDKVVAAVSGSYSASTRAAAGFSKRLAFLTFQPMRSILTSPARAIMYSELHL